MRKLITLALLLSAMPCFAAWQYESQGSLVTAASTNGTPLTVTMPAVVNPGDTLIYIAHDNNTGESMTWSNSPTLLCGSTTSSPVSISATVAVGNEDGTTVTISASGTGRVQAVILRYSGGPSNLSGIVHDCQNAGGGATTGLPWPGLTVTQNNTLVLVVGGKSNVAWTSVTPDAGTERVDAASGSIMSLVVDEVVQTTAANFSSGSWTITGDGSGARRTVAVSLLSNSTCGADGATTCQSIVLSSIGTGSPCEAFNAATNPDLAAGDVLKAPTITHPGGYALTIGTDCQFSFIGDGSRQDALNIAIFDTSAGGWHADDIDAWINNQTPVCQSDVVFHWNEGDAIDPVDANQYCADSESDALTTTEISGLASGVTLDGSGCSPASNSCIHGTPAGGTAGFSTLVLQTCDSTGDCVTWQ